MELDPASLQRRLNVFQVGETDLALLRSLRPLAEAHGQQVVEDLYDLLQVHPLTQGYLQPDKVDLNRLKQLQHRYLLELFEGCCDLAYAHKRIRLGWVHDSLDLPTHWCVGTYACYLRLLFDLLVRELPVAKARTAYSSLCKIVAFDISLAVDTSLHSQRNRLAAQQAALHDLAPPVMLVYPGALLLPVVCELDRQRCEEMMATLLAQVVATRSSVVIVDVQGLGLADTQVSQCLLHTASAAGLLGARTIVTGVSARVALTWAELGVDLAALDTRSQLADGFELALSLLGKNISPSD